MKHRPLFILADLESGGAQRVILNVLRRLSRRAFEPHLALVDKNGPMAGDIPKDIQVHNLEAGRVRYAIPGILRLVRTLKPHSVVSTLGHLNLAVLWAKRFFPNECRLIVREANTASVRLRYARVPWLYRMLYKRLYPRADRIICNSEYMRNDLLDAFSLPEQRTVVIRNPVDTEAIHNLFRDGRSPYHSGKCHLVSAGRLNYQKGFDMLLRAFKETRRYALNVHLTLIGKGPEEKTLKGMAETLGVRDMVTFAGPQDNPFPYLACADLFVSSSRWEGSPNAVLEALACGTPVLAFDCPGGTAEIIQEGRNGWLVPAEDEDALGRKIASIVRNETWKALKGKTLLPEKFRAEVAVREYESLLLGEKDKGPESRAPVSYGTADERN